MVPSGRICVLPAEWAARSPWRHDSRLAAEVVRAQGGATAQVAKQDEVRLAVPAMPEFLRLARVTAARIAAHGSSAPNGASVLAATGMPACINDAIRQR